MNWLLVVVLVILAGHTIKGYRRGLLRVLFSVASLLITVLFVAWATPYVSNFLKENTKIYQKVETKCEQKVRKDTKEQIAQKEEKSTGLLEEYGIRLPKSIEEKLFGNVEKGADSVLETSGVYKAMAEPLAQLAVDGIAFFVSLIVCAIIPASDWWSTGYRIRTSGNKGNQSGVRFRSGIVVWFAACLAVLLFCRGDAGISVWTESVGGDTAE